MSSWCLWMLFISSETRVHLWTELWTLWAATWENIPSVMYAQRRLKSACISDQSTLSAFRNYTSLAIQDFPSTDSDQPARMRNLIWTMKGRRYPKVRFLTLRQIWLIVLGFNDTSTLEGHFVSSPREKEKRDRRESRGDEREGQGRKRNRNESQERNKNIPPLPLPTTRIAGLVQL